MQQCEKSQKKKKGYPQCSTWLLKEKPAKLTTQAPRAQARHTCTTLWSSTGAWSVNKPFLGCSAWKHESESRLPKQVSWVDRNHTSGRHCGTGSQKKAPKSQRKAEQWTEKRRTKNCASVFSLVGLTNWQQTSTKQTGEQERLQRLLNEAAPERVNKSLEKIANQQLRKVNPAKPDGITHFKPDYLR